MGLKTGALGYLIGQEIYDRTYDTLDDQAIADEARSGGISTAIGLATSQLGRIPSYVVNKQTNTVKDFYGRAKPTTPIEGLIKDSKSLALFKSAKANFSGEVDNKLTKYYQLNSDPNGHMNWKIDYNKYKNSLKANNPVFNTTPEEFRLKLLHDSSMSTTRGLEKQSQYLDNEIYKNRNNPTRVAHLNKELNKVNNIKVQAGKTGRYYRSEIMKNEIQNGFLLNKSYSANRIREAGYVPMGTSRYADVSSKFGIPQKSLDAWSDDVGFKNINQADKRVILFKNTHRGDRMMFNSLNKNAHSLAADVSYQLGTGRIENAKDLKMHLMNQIKRSNMNEFKLGRRQYAKLGGTNYAQYLKDGAAYTKDSILNKGGGEFRKANLKMADNLSDIISSQKPWSKGSLGKFTLPNLGGVTAQYFEGGVNMQGDYVFDGNNGNPRVHSRRIKTDVHDIFKSGKLQKNIPLLYDEHYNTHSINKKGVWNATSMNTRFPSKYPFNSERKKRIIPNISNNIEDVKTFSRGGVRKKNLASLLRNNPKKFAIDAIKLFSGKTAIGQTLKIAGYAMDAASVAYLMMEAKEFISPYIFNMSDEDGEFPTKD